MSSKTYAISKRFGWGGQITEKVGHVMRMFGVTADRLNESAITHSCQLRIRQSDIVYITGPSGAGKSVLLRELEESIGEEERINLAEIEFSDNRAVVDCVGGDLLSALKVLSIAGLNDCLCLLNNPASLSDGQKYRYRLAMAMAGGKKFIFADEFCSNLDRITAAVICYNVYKYAKRCGVTFVLASSHEDILSDLQPDVLVVKELAGAARVTYKQRRD